MIAGGHIALNGVPLDTPATLVASLAGVTVDGVPVEAAGAARLFLYHKPAGLLVTERDPAGRPTIYDRLPPGLPGWCRSGGSIWRPRDCCCSPPTGP